MVCICIDLKSFYASVECVERGLDPMTTNLVVADPTRTEKTICLAISPSMKAMGVKNRCRVFEIPKNIRYIMAPPRMQYYIDYAAKIYGVYIKYISPDDIHVYSIDEVFIDVTNYLDRYNKTPREMAEFLMSEVLREVGVRATAGIGSNLYLAKIALDITAKHARDFIGELDEEAYRQQLWDHQPLHDFWMIGSRTEARLARYGIHTMRQITETPEDFLYKQFGINAELLIDHAWGRESCEISDIKSYVRKSHSVSSGQVLKRPYNAHEAEIIVREMCDAICLDLIKKNLVTRSVAVVVRYTGDGAGLHSVGTASFDTATNLDNVITPAIIDAYRSVVDVDIPIRGIQIACNDVKEDDGQRQMSLFDGDAEEDKKQKALREQIINLKRKYGNNAVFKGTDLQEAATALERNNQIGGHKA